MEQIDALARAVTAARQRPNGIPSTLIGSTLDARTQPIRPTVPEVADWSTRQLAEITGTTIRAIRHYHAIGLLAEPERSRNGYKHYRTSHVVRVLEIRRLAALGLPLAQIATMDDTSCCPAPVLQTLERELAQQIERIERARAELATWLGARSARTGR